MSEAVRTGMTAQAGPSRPRPALIAALAALLLADQLGAKYERPVQEVEISTSSPPVAARGVDSGGPEAAGR
jgi:hypothetical protein